MVAPKYEKDGYKLARGVGFWGTKTDKVHTARKIDNLESIAFRKHSYCNKERTHAIQ